MVRWRTCSLKSGLWSRSIKTKTRLDQSLLNRNRNTGLALEVRIHLLLAFSSLQLIPSTTTFHLFSSFRNAVKCFATKRSASSCHDSAARPRTTNSAERCSSTGTLGCGKCRGSLRQQSLAQGETGCAPVAMGTSHRRQRPSAVSIRCEPRLR